MYLLRHQGIDDLPELIRQAAGKHENPAAHIALSRISQPFGNMAATVIRLSGAAGYLAPTSLQASV